MRGDFGDGRTVPRMKPSGNSFAQSQFTMTEGWERALSDGEAEAFWNSG